MKTISTIQEFRKWRKGITGRIGFVPTMGALHAGHLSLVEESIATCQNTIVSIYLNPAQFAPGEDLDSYPKTIDTDLKKLSHLQINCVFLPNDSEMYPKEFSTQIQVYHDILGLYGDLMPKHTKRYGNLGTEIQGKLAEYKKEVEVKKFPSQKHFITSKVPPIKT